MMKRILLVAVAVVVGVPLLMTVWFYIGGIEFGDTSLPDDADLVWTPPVVADEDNAFVAILAATNLINCATLGTNSWDKADMSFVSGYANINTNRDSTARRIRADPDAGEKADRILADNEAFYAAFAKGWSERGFETLCRRSQRKSVLQCCRWVCFSACRISGGSRFSGRWNAANGARLSRTLRPYIDLVALFPTTPRQLWILMSATALRAWLVVKSKIL